MMTGGQLAITLLVFFVVFFGSVYGIYTVATRKANQQKRKGRRRPGGQRRRPRR